jgi:hypothetical protein
MALACGWARRPSRCVNTGEQEPNPPLSVPASRSTWIRPGACRYVSLTIPPDIQSPPKPKSQMPDESISARLSLANVANCVSR